MASLRLRNSKKHPAGIWHIAFRVHGRSTARTTGIAHDGKFINGEPVPPEAVKQALRDCQCLLDQSRQEKKAAEMMELFDREETHSELLEFVCQVRHYLDAIERLVHRQMLKKK